MILDESQICIRGLSEADGSPQLTGTIHSAEGLNRAKRLTSPEEVGVGGFLLPGAGTSVFFLLLDSHGNTGSSGWGGR